MNCNQCGASIRPGTTHCENCGAGVNAAPVGHYGQPMGYGQPTARGYRPMPPAPPASNAPLSIGAYLLLFFLSALPLAGTILLIIWAVTGDNQNKKNFARAMLIIQGAMLVLTIVFAFAATGMLLQGL